MVSESLALKGPGLELEVPVRVPRQEEGEAMAAGFVSAAAGAAVAFVVDNGPVAPWRTLHGGLKADPQCLISLIV